MKYKRNSNKNIKKWIFIGILILFSFVYRKSIYKTYQYFEQSIKFFNYKMVNYKSDFHRTSINFEEKVKLLSNVEKYIEENKELKEKLQEKIFKEEYVEEILKENKIIRENLELQKKLEFETIVAEVKLSEIYDENILYITKGSKNGIQENQVVIYDGNMIGRVSRVSEDYSEITLLTSKDSKISINLNGGYLAILRGNGNGSFSIKNYNTDINMENENHFEIKTSGISDTIIKDIKIGDFKIKDKDLFLKTKELIFKPDYKYADIRLVLIVKEVK